MKNNVTVIGCGARGKMFAEEWAKREDSRIKTVFDLNSETASAVAEKVSADTAVSWEEAVNDTEINIVTIATPAAFHSKAACYAAELGKHVITEKPVALTLDQADNMVKAAEVNKVTMAVSYQYREFPCYIKLRDMFRSGDFGGPVFFRFTDVREVRPKTAMHQKNMNGGPVIDMAGHYFDLMRCITESEPISVYAKGHIFGKGKKRLKRIDDFAVDAADILVNFENGHTCSVFVNWGMPEDFEAVTDMGFAAGPDLSVQVKDYSTIEIRKDKKTETLELAKPETSDLSRKIDDFIHAIETGGTPEVSARDGRISLAVSIAALRSIETGEPQEIS